MEQKEETPKEVPLGKNQLKYLENKEKYHTRCEKIVSNIFQNNPYLKFMIDTMDKMGCTIKREFYKCGECPIRTGGFYDSKSGVTICENNIFSKRVIEDTIMHETIHAYDYCRANLNPENCVHIACSEIRANNLSKECKFSREIGRKQFNFLRHQADCVKRRSELILSNIPHCKDNAPLYINAAWRSCYSDTSPFQNVP